MSLELDSVKQDVAVANRILAELGLATGALSSYGHASMRVPADAGRFVVKGRGYAIDVLAEARAEDMIVCDVDGFMLEGPPGCTQCFEVKMHSCIYKTHPGVAAVVHVHPRFVVLMSVLEAPLQPMCQEGIMLVRTPLPVYPHCKTVVTEEEGMEVAAALGEAPAIILQGHGATAVGATLEEAVMTMMQLEEQARMNWYAYCAQGARFRSIDDSLIEEMLHRTPLAELPHFRGPMAGAQPALGGLYAYCRSRVG